MAKYRIDAHVFYELIVEDEFSFETETLTPPLWDQALALVRSKIELLKLTLPAEVQAAFDGIGGMGARIPQLGPGRFLMKDFDIRCEEIES